MLPRLGLVMPNTLTAHALSELLKGHGLTLTRMARGLPVGGELEHTDPGTLAQALFERRGVTGN